MAFITIRVTSGLNHRQIKASHDDTRTQIKESFNNARKSNEYSEKLKDIKYCVVQLSDARIISVDFKQIADQTLIALKESQTHLASPNGTTLDVERIQNGLMDDYNKMVGHANNIYAYCKLLDLSPDDLKKIGDMITKIGANNKTLRKDIHSTRYKTKQMMVTLNLQMFKDMQKNYKNISELAETYRNGFTDFINLFIKIKKSL